MMRMKLPAFPTKGQPVLLKTSQPEAPHDPMTSRTHDPPPQGQICPRGSGQSLDDYGPGMIVINGVIYLYNPYKWPEIDGFHLFFCGKLEISGDIW